MDRENPASNNSNLERYSIEGLWFDPELREFLDGPVAEAQAKLAGCEDPEEIDRILEDLNETWASDCPWLDGCATISGKVRALHFDDSALIEEKMRKLGYEPKTQNGEDYFEAVNLAVLASYFEIQYCDDEPVLPPRIGLSLFLDDEDWFGNLIIFPEEISSVKFEMPSIKAIEARMGVEGSSELVERIHSALDNLNGDTAKTLEQLKTLRFSAAEFPEAAKFFHEVGLVAYSCCDFDEGEYDVQISGEVFTYDDEGGFTSATLDEPIDVTAPICGVQFLPQDGGIYQPALVFAVKTAAYGDSADYVSYIVPVENIENLSRFERLALKFGRAALALGSPMELSEHQAELAASDRTGDVAQKEVNDLSAAIEDLEEMLAGGHEAPRDTEGLKIKKPEEGLKNPLVEAAREINEIPEQTYDPERGVFFVAASGDLRTLQECLSDYLETLRILGTGTGFSDEDLEKIEKFLNEKDVPHLERLTLGGRVRVRGENLSLTPLDGNVNLDLSDDFALEGTFDGVKIGVSERDHKNLRRKARKTPVKSEKSPSLPKNASKIPGALGFSIILKDCQVPGQSETFDAILHCAPGYFPKLEAIEPASH